MLICWSSFGLVVLRLTQLYSVAPSLTELRNVHLALQEKRTTSSFISQNLLCTEGFFYISTNGQLKMLKQLDQLESNYFFTAVSQPAVIIMFIM